MVPAFSTLRAMRATSPPSEPISRRSSPRSRWKLPLKVRFAAPHEVGVGDVEGGGEEGAAGGDTARGADGDAGGLTRKSEPVAVMVPSRREGRLPTTRLRVAPEPFWKVTALP